MSQFFFLVDYPLNSASLWIVSGYASSHEYPKSDVEF